MKSLFNTQERLEIVNRISSIRQDTPRLWGKMTPSQMLLHCQSPLKVSIGELKLGSSPLFMILGPLIKKKRMKEQAFEQNLPTHKHFIVNFDPEFAIEKAKLIDLVNTFADSKDRLAPKHPMFGKMNTQQWDALNWKHLDHHLRQFGA